MNNNLTNNVNYNSEIAQFVILDVGVPNPAQLSDAVLSSVSNILCLSNVGHIPAVGLALINASYQPVVRLSSTQSSFKLLKILHAIKSVEDTGKCRARISTQEFQDYILLGIKTALEEFENLANELTEGEVCPEKLQISIFSMKNLKETLDYMIMALPLIKTQHLFKIQVVELVEEFLNENCSRKELCSYTYLDYFQVAGTAKQLDEVMKQWLFCGDVIHHLTLVMQTLSISCDARDCLIRPSLTSSTNTTAVTCEETPEDADILEVIHRVPTVGICETHTFGDPVLLVPCQWQNHLQSEHHEEIVHNAKYFLDLCKKLGMSEEYLVAKYKKINQPVRFMLLMPGEGVLLVKELLSAEMALPISNTSKSLSPFTTFKMDAEVTTALVCLPSISSYDPCEFSSGLYRHLFRKMEHSTTLQLRQDKKELPCEDTLREFIAVNLEVKKKTKVKRKTCDRKRIRKCSQSAGELPQLTESDQQTLAQCLSKSRLKFKST